MLKPDLRRRENVASSAEIAAYPASSPMPAREGGSTRYSDQPLSLKTRLLGMGGVGAIVLVMAASVFLSWRVYTAMQVPPTLSVFDVAPPAAPPELKSEIPPGPQQVQKEKAEVQPDRLEIEVTEIQILSQSPISPEAAKPIAEAGPPIKETTAPESKPQPPAQKMSDAKPTWEGRVLGALNKVKRYPREASFRRQQGVPYIRFVMDRDGHVLSVRLERASGIRSLDDEAASLPKRADPLPKPPDDVKGDAIELVVPVEFFMQK